MIKNKHWLLSLSCQVIICLYLFSMKITQPYIFLKNQLAKQFSSSLAKNFICIVHICFYFYIISYLYWMIFICIVELYNFHFYFYKFSFVFCLRDWLFILVCCKESHWLNLFSTKAFERVMRNAILVVYQES